MSENRQPNRKAPPRRPMGGPGFGGPMMMPGEKAKNFKGTLSRLLKYLKPGALLDGQTCGFTLYDKWWPIARSDSFTLGEAVYASIE